MVLVYVAQGIHLITYLVPLQRNVLNIVLQKIQKLHKELLTTILRQSEILRRIQLVLGDGQDVFMGHSRKLDYVMFGWRRKHCRLQLEMEKIDERKESEPWIDKQR